MVDAMVKWLVINMYGRRWTPVCPVLFQVWVLSGFVAIGASLSPITSNEPWSGQPGSRNDAWVSRVRALGRAAYDDVSSGSVLSVVVRV